MKNTIHRIRRQPEHIRQLVAAGCTVVVGSLVIAFWFHSFQTTTFALLNPGQEEPASSRTFAVSPNSLFGYIGNAFSDIKAEMGGLFGGSTTIENDIRVSPQPDGPVYPLPISDYR